MNYKTFAALLDARLAAARKSQTGEDQQQLDEAAIEELLDFVHGVDGGAALVCAAARDALADAAAAAEAAAVADAAAAAEAAAEAAVVPGEDVGEAVMALRSLSQKAVVTAEQLHLPHEKRGRMRVDASQVENLFKPAPASTLLLHFSSSSSSLLSFIIFLLLMLLPHPCSSSQAGRTH
jgi:hypothetical protein